MSERTKSERPAAFFSYVHSDDEHDGGQITRLHDLLQGEVRMQLGEADFDIFLDRDDIAWGQNWRGRIDASLGAVTLLIPIVTPTFFASAECRRELERFLTRENELRRDDLILPIYYVSAPQLDDAQRRDTDPLAQLLAGRQHADWRELRFEPFTSPIVRQRVAQLANRMRDSFRRTEPAAADPGLPAPHGIQRAATGPETAADRAGKLTPRNEPPTLTVDPWGHGDHTTISTAIRAARPGTRIIVRSGLYEEGLVVDKPLEILGQGPVQDVIVRARKCVALLFKANIGRVSNLTLQQGGGGQFFAVDIAQGRLELEDCDITSRSRSAVAVHGGADPRVRRNRIHDAHASGIFVYEQGLGTFEDNDVFANALSGFEVKGGANPTVRRNRVHDGRQNGFFVHEQGLGTFEDNDVFANALSGFEVKGGANPSVRRNRVHDGRRSGLFVHDGGLGSYEDNDIVDNAGVGISVGEGGDPTVRRNRVNRNGLAGVTVYGGGRGTFQDNDLTANAEGAWEIAPESEEHVHRRDNAE